MLRPFGIRLLAQSYIYLPSYLSPATSLLSKMTAAVSRPSIPLGSSVPPMTAHAVSVSLPTWKDNVGYEEGDKRVMEKLETGYPRFFVHRSIQKLASLCLNKFGRPDTELAMLFPSPRVAAEARDFLANQTPSISSRIVEFVICPSITNLQSPCEPTSSKTSFSNASVEVIELQILLFPKDQWGFAKSFWQHTGDGVSSRLAERALNFMGEVPPGSQAEGSAPTTSLDAAPQKIGQNYKNRHYAKRQGSVTATPAPPIAPSTPAQLVQDPSSKLDVDVSATDLTTYLEERYGRNLPMFNAPLAKQALKRRIAGGLLPSDEDFGKVEDVARGAEAGTGKKAVTPDDVYLYPGGMSAIWHAHNISRKLRRGTGEKEGKSISYGFPYIDTLKILEKWGPGGILLGQGGSEDISPLQDLLESRKPEEGKILALFCEFPGNPLLRSPDLVKIRELADKHGFIVVVDETIGNFINVEVMTYADIVVSSLTKIFSGESNVMGGSLVLNPNSAFYEQLKTVLATDFEDLYYPEDVVYMERNSRDFRARIKQVNDNAYDITEYLYSRSIEDTSTPSTGKAIKKVYYPRYVTPEIYAQAQRSPTLGKGGFGGLFSVTFTSLAASEAFFDTIQCAKGPSLGTSFTLASPYTLLAHYNELDWAAKYGVDSGLVRISVGQEDTASLREWFEEAVLAAERAS